VRILIALINGQSLPIPGQARSLIVQKSGVTVFVIIFFLIMFVIGNQMDYEL